MYKTICDMAHIYMATSGKPANELRAYPATMDHIVAGLERETVIENFSIVATPGDDMIIVNTHLGRFTFIWDDTIPPGTFYLDRDGQSKEKPRLKRVTIPKFIDR